MILITYTQIKAFISAKKLAVQWYEAENTYYLFAVDGLLGFEARIYKDDSSDQIDFEAGLKIAPSANTALWQYDADGAQIVRIKAAKKGWTYQALSMEFETAKLSDTLFCKDYLGVDVPGITLKAYDGSSAEVTTAGAAGVNLPTIAKTVVDFEPAYDYEVIGGVLRTASTIDTDMRLWILAVPDIQESSGGSKQMAVGINLRYLTPGNEYNVDGRVTKLLTYNATYHTNKLRFILTYPAGTNETLSLVLEYYRP